MPMLTKLSWSIVFGESEGAFCHSTNASLVATSEAVVKGSMAGEILKK